MKKLLSELVNRLALCFTLICLGLLGLLFPKGVLKTMKESSDEIREEFLTDMDEKKDL